MESAGWRGERSESWFWSLAPKPGLSVTDQNQGTKPMRMLTTRRTAAYDTGTLLGFGPKRKAATMTLALALHGEECVVLAADKQETKTYKGGNYIENVTKLIEIDGSQVFAMAGPSPCENMFLTTTKSLLKTRPMNPELLGSLSTRLKNKFDRTYRTKREREDNHAGFLLVGVDDENEFSVNYFESPNFYPLPEKSFGTIGSREQSLYFLWQIYDKTKPSKPIADQLILLACFCINETAKQSSLVGKDMDIWILRKGQPIEKLTQARIEEIHKEAEEISGAIAEKFLMK